METITFDPTVADLKSIVAITSQVTADDLLDDKQLQVVKENRISLRDARITIERQGKAMRADALKYQKDVIAREKELIGIIEPEEIRLKDLEDKANVIKERQARLALLPMRREQLDNIKDNTIISDEEILDMDNDEFIVHLNTRITLKNETDRAELETEKLQMARAKELEAAKEHARVQERLRIEQSMKLDEERRVQKIAQEKYDADMAIKTTLENARIQAEKVLQDAKDKLAKEEAEAKAQEIKTRQEAESRSQEVKYQQWLTAINYKKEEAINWKFIDDGTTVTAYKQVSSFKHSQ